MLIECPHPRSTLLEQFLSHHVACWARSSTMRWKVNHKRVYRSYREERLAMRRTGADDGLCSRQHGERKEVPNAESDGCLHSGCAGHRGGHVFAGNRPYQPNSKQLSQLAAFSSVPLQSSWPLSMRAQKGLTITASAQAHQAHGRCISLCHRGIFGQSRTPFDHCWITCS